MSGHISGPTPFVESNAFLAAHEGDSDELAAILAAMSVRELSDMRDACTRLDRALQDFGS